MDHKARDHAEYGGSGASRWMTCFAAIKEARRCPPSPESPWAADGTAAHELLDAAMRYGFRSARICNAVWFASLHPLERCDAVQHALDHVYDILDMFPDAILHVETAFEIDNPFTQDAWGTVDIAIYIPSLNFLIILDYKHGQGIAVHVWTQAKGPNKQLMFYALGVCRTLGIKPDNIRLTVAQPRKPHKDGVIRHHDVAYAELEKFGDEIELAIAATMVDNPTYDPCYDNCHYCNGMLCDARDRTAANAIGNFGSVIMIDKTNVPAPNELDMTKLVQIVAMGDFVKDYINQAQAYLESLALSGKSVPGMKLVEAQAKRRWDGNEDEIVAGIVAATGCELDEIYPRKLAGITDAEKLIKQSLRDQLGMKAKDATEVAKREMEKYSTKDTTGALKLVDLSDGRPAVNPTQVTFANVQVIAPPKP